MKKLFTAFLSVLILASGCAFSQEWKLVSGTLPSADTEPLIFEGNVVLSGWGVTVPYYTGDPELHFHVAPESVKNLPKDFNFTKYNWDFKLENSDKAFDEALSKSTNSSKSEIVVDKLTIPNEGHPLLHLAESKAENS